MQSSFTKTDEYQAKKWLGMTLDGLAIELEGQGWLDARGGKTDSKGVLSDLRDRFSKLSDDAKMKIQKFVCIDLDYCAHAEKKSWKVVEAIAGCFAFEFRNLSVSYILLAVIFVKFGLLDVVCGCA